MVPGLSLAAALLLLGVGAAVRQFGTLRRMREEPYMPEVDQRYYRGQAWRRLIASGLLVVIGTLIAYYYLSGMDARMDQIPERNKGGEQPAADDPQTQADKEFTRFVAIYWITVIVLVGAVVLMAILDFWATRLYWMSRYRELRADHETKLQRDLAVYRQQKLNDRAKGLKPPDEPAEQ
jgi:hypothetical protein